MKATERLTVTQAAAESGYSPVTVYRALKAGRLRGYRRGNGPWKIERADLAAWLTESPNVA